jgi:hypothetical protein
MDLAMVTYVCFAAAGKYYVYDNDIILTFALGANEILYKRRSYTLRVRMKVCCPSQLMR